MDQEHLYAYLEDLLEQLGVSVRYESLDEQEFPVSSGLCTLKGTPCFIMDRSERLSERIRLLVDCLKGLDLEGVYIKPAIREFLLSQRDIS